MTKIYLTFQLDTR